MAGRATVRAVVRAGELYERWPDFPERGGMGGPGPKGKGGKSPGGRGDDRGPPLFLTPPTRAELVQILTPPQRLRLRQIFLQVRGPMAFNEPEVVEALQLTADQRQQIRVLQIGPFGRPGGFFGGPPPKGPWGGPEEFARVTEQILNSLTPEQREKWRALTGKPFNPSPS